MIFKPPTKKAIVFIDGQNLYRAAKEAFGYTFPNYDIKKLADWVCRSNGWTLAEVYFYTGVPDPEDNLRWHTFWSKKLSYMGRVGVKNFSRSLRYHNEEFRCPSCNKEYTQLVGHEKGVDVRIALDIIHFAHAKTYDIAVIFSQDQDLTEVVDEVARISKEQKRPISVFSAFPVSPTFRNTRGINRTAWIRIDKKTYDTCIDSGDYR